jgi:hypothetical protein
MESDKASVVINNRSFSHTHVKRIKGVVECIDHPGSTVGILKLEVELVYNILNLSLNLRNVVLNNIKNFTVHHFNQIVEEGALHGELDIIYIKESSFL